MSRAVAGGSSTTRRSPEGMVDDFFRLSGRHGDGSYKRNRDFFCRWWTRANNGKLRAAIRLCSTLGDFFMKYTSIRAGVYLPLTPHRLAT